MTMKVDIYNTDKKYNIIYADPPWSYRDKALAGNRGAGCKYPVMSTGDIAQLPINKITHDDCALFLWVTMPKLNECFDLIEKWGFTYKTCGFIWVKKNKKSNSNFMGMGRWTRANAELCLFATKGKPKRVSASVRSVVESPIEAHSKKPDIIREKIVELMGDLPRIELFARQHAEGWDCWGNEV
jgi:N6-adenosine-specific RNA methylase IME4